MTRLNPFAPQAEPRILIAFISAHHPSRWPYVADQRARMKNSPVDYKFVYGDVNTQEGATQRTPLSDELFCSVDDTKAYMVLKDKALFHWALLKGYDFIFRACDDSVVYPERLLSHLDTLKRYDYAGTMCGYGKLLDQEGREQIFTLRYLDYMHGGVGIWLSRKAMEMLLADNWKGPFSSPYPNNIEIVPGQYFKGGWNIYWDDLWIGEVLKGNLNYNDPKRNFIYENYLVNVLDDPTLFASNTPFDADKVIATHALDQMGTTDLRPQPFSTLDDLIPRLAVDWDRTTSSFSAVAPK